MGTDEMVTWIFRVPYHPKCTGPPDVRICKKCEKNMDMILDDYVKVGDERWCTKCWLEYKFDSSQGDKPIENLR